MRTFEAFPTMVTPLKWDNSVDYATVEKLTRWYWEQGCDGIFASCQSSEIWFLPEEDRVQLAQVVKDTADYLYENENPDARPRMTVVASGHVSDDFDIQVRELSRVAATNVDAVILITNRLDIANTSDEAWIADGKRLLESLPEHIHLGLYECPYPYKRLLTPAMLKWAVSTGRFYFIKDTCCDAQEIDRRMDILRGSDIRLFNANAQTLYDSLKSGAAGYCGVMANFHPALYVWLTKHMDDPKAREVADWLSIAAFTEQLAYPVTAKYHLSAVEGLPIGLNTLSRAPEQLTPYHKMCVEQMNRSAVLLLESIGE